MDCLIISPSACYTRFGMNSIRRVAVLGAGTMGSRIAAHFANAGIPSLLLDIVVPGAADRNAAAKKGLDAAWKGRPGGFFTDALPALITPGNFEDDLEKIADCDWIIEAVTEKLDVKRELWTRVAAVRRPGSIVSTNTSGIPLALIADGFSEEFRGQFLGTHFFNPPRYLHLCEVIPGPATDPDLLTGISEFIDRRLGKGVVLCKDTPNFIGNRIGSMWGSTTFKYAMEDDFTVEEVDALTGSLIGLPNSASFRLIDIVGVDVWYHVGGNLYAMVPDDPWRDRFQPHAVMEELMKRGWLGEKTGQGFFKRVGPAKEIHALNLKTFEYSPAARPKFASVEQAKLIEDLPARLRALVASTDKAGTFLWKLMRDSMLYSAERVPEISDRIVEIDRAMRWGYAHTYGPFELWDALGFTETARRMEADGLALPASILTMLSRGARSFYRSADENRQPRTDYFDLGAGHYARLEERPGVVSIADVKRAGGTVKKNTGCSLVDLGDGVLGVEFHSKMNSLGEDQMSLVQGAFDECRKGFQAIVIGNQGELFSAGANLMMVLMLAQDEEFDDLNTAIHQFQQGMMSIKYAPVPVVVAAHGRALGGGCEMILHGPRVQVAAELYAGLVETGVGLIPGGGGCKEMILRHGNPKAVFETIGYAKVTTSADDARKLGFLDSTFTAEIVYSKIDEALRTTNENLKPLAGALSADGRQRFNGNPANSASGVGLGVYPGYTNMYRVSNVSVGESTYVSFQWDRPMKNKWAFNLAYTRGRATEAQANGQTTAGGQFQRNVVFNQNTVEVGTADFQVKDRIQLSLTRQFEMVKNWRSTASLYYEGRSGNPYSWVFGGDLNNDGTANNDVLMVPTDANDSKFDFSGMTSPQRDAMFAYIQKSGLAQYAGGKVPKNSFIEPWFNRLDLKFVQNIPIQGSTKMEIFVDFVNFGYFLSKKTFGYTEIAPFLQNDVFRTRSLTGSATAYATDGRIKPTYTADPVGYLIDNGMSRWRVQLGAKISF